MNNPARFVLQDREVVACRWKTSSGFGCLMGIVFLALICVNAAAAAARAETYINSWRESDSNLVGGYTPKAGSVLICNDPPKCGVYHLPTGMKPTDHTGLAAVYPIDEPPDLQIYVRVASLQDASAAQSSFDLWAETECIPSSRLGSETIKTDDSCTKKLFKVDYSSYERIGCEWVHVVTVYRAAIVTLGNYYGPFIEGNNQCERMLQVILNLLNAVKWRLDSKYENPKMVLVPEIINFGQVKIESSKTRTLIIKNTGKGQLEIRGWHFSAPNQSDIQFFDFEQGEQVVEPASFVIWQVHYHPMDSGEHLVFIFFDTNDPDFGSSLLLQGEGVDRLRVPAELPALFELLILGE